MCFQLSFPFSRQAIRSIVVDAFSEFITCKDIFTASAFDAGSDEVKAGLLLYSRQLTPNMKLRGREKSHAGRATIRDSMFAEADTHLVYTTYLLGKSSVFLYFDKFPSINRVWRAKQALVVRPINEPVIAAHSAPHRFESMSHTSMLLAVDPGSVLLTLEDATCHTAIAIGIFSACGPVLFILSVGGH